VEDKISGGLQHCYKTCCKKGGHCGRQACMIWRWFYCGDIISRWVDLHMTILQFMLFCIGVSTFRKKFLIKDGMCGAENDIFLYMVYRAIIIILISNEYYQFRIWHNFVGINFTGEKHIGFIAKDIEVQYFGFITQENHLRCSLLETSNRYTIIYMSCNCYCKFLLEIW